MRAISLNPGYLIYDYSITSILPPLSSMQRVNAVKSHSVIPGQRITMVVACKDDDVENIIRAVREVANTGEIGDGKIFVTELNDVVRIRTGETGEDATKENSND